MYSWKSRFVAVAMATAATPAMAQLDTRADLVTPQTGHAGPGDVVVDTA